MVPYEKLYKASIEKALSMKGGTGGSKQEGLMSRHQEDDRSDDDAFDAIEMNAYYIRMFWDMAEEGVGRLRAAGEKRLGKGEPEEEEEEEPEEQ